MSTEPTLTADRLRELLHYDPDTGEFRRRRLGGDQLVGVAVGNTTNRYRRISIDGTVYYAHRLAWLYVHGIWPQCQVDHINGSRLDNRIANLREATQAQNLQNRITPARHNKSGFLGVRLDPRGARWIAYIGINRRSRELGRFDTPEAAAAAYLAAKRELHPFWAEA